MNCIVCGMNIDPEIALHNTGVPDCCDVCALQNREKYLVVRHGKSLTKGQIALIRTIWELAQSRIDDLYSPEGAEAEKQAVEKLMKNVFPEECDEFIRAKGEST